MKSLLNLLGTVLGLSCVWAYLQKGFFVSSLISFPGVNDTFSILTLLFSLIACLALFVSRRNALEVFYNSHRSVWILFTLALVLTEIGVFFGAAEFSQQKFSSVFCILYYVLQGFGIVGLFFGWILHLLRIAYDQKLSVVVIVLFATLALSRFATTAIYGWNTLLNIEMIFMLGVSACLWLVCYDFKRGTEPLCNVRIVDSLSAKAYIPTLTAFIALDVISRMIQMLDTESTWMLDYNPSREISLLIILVLCLLIAALPASKRSGLDKKGIFFLMVGLTIGITIGQLFGMVTGASTPALFFNFTETVRALLRATLFFILFFLVYETSVSPVVMFGGFLILPIILNRISYLIPRITSNLPAFLPELQNVLLILIAMCFLFVMGALLKTFIKSNTFLLLIERGRNEPTETDGFLKRVAVSFALTERETEIFEYLANGYSSKRIGDKLYISPYTVQNHTKCIYRKMGIHSKQELIDFAEKWRSDT